MNKQTVEVDFCVVGGGLAGMCAAIAAARHGAKVALVHDRPVLGGNASSEVRMWICGAEQKGFGETGIVEELLLENAWRNPFRNASIWDSILYGAVMAEKNIELFLNCSCFDATLEGSSIRSVECWQTTTQRRIVIEAELFADCSGDSILAALSGAHYRIGREEFGETLQPVEADSRTMGMSCLLQARETNRAQRFVAPDWAYKYEKADDLKPNVRSFNPNSNYWWLELGGMGDSIGDTERVRDELIKTAFGVWDWYKNRSPERTAENWVLDWVGFLPGKRESRRCLGDVLLTQRDIEEGREFPDAVAYGGWPLDDHDPHGFQGRTPSNVSIPLSAPYQIPYRALYSRNVSNLFFAGRNISVTHAALSSARVMCTCAICGQAIGVAAAVAVRGALSPRGVFESASEELRQTLLEDDCYIPGAVRAVADVVRKSVFVAAPAAHGLERFFCGVDREVGDSPAPASIPIGTALECRLPSPVSVSRIRLVFDSDIDRLGSHKLSIASNYPLEQWQLRMPETLVRDFRLDFRRAGSEEWIRLASVTENRRRLVAIPCPGEPVEAFRLVPERLWGDGVDCRMFAFDFK